MDSCLSLRLERLELTNVQDMVDREIDQLCNNVKCLDVQHK